jgi:hypothetical protein
MRATRSPCQEGKGMTDRMERLVAKRRAALSARQRQRLAGPLWGLALSGGGIRSATFCFGLLHSLARNKVFHKFDLMSTVSGGGYIGAMLGRLFLRMRPSAASPPSEVVEEALGDADRRWFTWWLRANGRYLIPNGAKDSFFAAATFGRNLLAVHLEIALVAVFLALFVCGFGLLVWFAADLWSSHIPSPVHWGALTLVAISGFPPLWLLIVPLAALGGLVAGAYWIYPSDTEQSISRWRFVAWAVALAFLLALCLYWDDLHLTFLLPLALLLPVVVLLMFLVTSAVVAFWIAPERTASSRRGLKFQAFAVATALILSLAFRHAPVLEPVRVPLMLAQMLAVLWLAGVGTAALFQLQREDRAATRNRLTAVLSGLMMVAFGAFVLGGLEYLAWQLSLGGRGFQGQVGLGVALLGIVLRAVVPKVLELPRSFPPGARHVLGSIVSLAGLMILAGLIVFWISAIHSLVTHRLFLETHAVRREPNFALAWYALGAIFVPAFLLTLASGSNIEFLNKSSLFTFYRSRLVRSYLGATNSARFGHDGDGAAGIVHATDQMPVHGSAPSPRNVFTVHKDDDIPMSAYVPHELGAPVHLINVCANQTRDPRGGLFNKDRKGAVVTVAGRHMRVGTGEWQPLPASDAQSMTLGSWTAISGAAIAPGLGGATRPGIAALTMMAGLRLGYWWSPGADSWWKKRLSKYRLLFSELLGRFDLRPDAPWFLSDGGHFENTAAYALLQEKCELIVVADAAADPLYAFADVENLVRKARIDLQADIQFLKPKAALDGLWESFGSLSDIASADSTASLALAEVHYAGQSEPAYLILVKPTMRAGLPVDLVNFKANNPAFPQQPTTDQSFGEAQWESYFRLGRILGDCLRPQVLANVAQVAQLHFAPDDGSLTRDNSGRPMGPAAAAAASAAAVPARRLPARIVAKGAVTASISLGAIASLGFTAYQAIGAEAKQRREARKTDPAEMKEISKLYAEWRATEARDSQGKSLVPLVVHLARLSEQVCGGPSVDGYRTSTQFTTIAEEANAACEGKACETLKPQMLESLMCLLPPQKQRSECIPQYWIRDYAGASNNCRTSSAPLRMYPQPSVEAAEAATAAAAAATAAAAAAATAPPAAGAPTSGPSTGTPSSTTGTSAGSAAGGQQEAAPTLQPQCAGKTVYVQIYGPEQREEARGLRPKWRELGASVPPIEDVVDSARRKNRPPPFRHPAPTILFHEAVSKSCAEALWKAAGAPPKWKIESLPKPLTATPNVLEVWLPPV